MLQAGSLGQSVCSEQKTGRNTFLQTDAGVLMEWPVRGRGWTRRNPVSLEVSVTTCPPHPTPESGRCSLGLEWKSWVDLFPSVLGCHICGRKKEDLRSSLPVDVLVLTFVSGLLYFPYLVNSYMHRSLISGLCTGG